MAIAETVTNILLKYGAVDLTKKDICMRGIELILMDALNITLIICLGLVLDCVIYSAIFLSVFCVLRKFCGGFHAKTFRMCRTVTIGSFLTEEIVRRLCGGHMIGCSIVCNIVALTTMIGLSPIAHPNRKLTVGEKKINRTISIALELILTLISTTLAIKGHDVGLSISVSTSIAALLMHAGKFYNRRLS